MPSAPRRRGIESVDNAREGVEQPNVGAADADATDDVEHGSTSADARSIESVTDERSADPFNDERSNIERP